MAPVVGDILQITDVQTFLGETLLNIYFYEMLTADGDLDYETIKVVFFNDIVERSRNLQSTFCNHVRVIIKNLTNELDIAEFPVDGNGVVTGQAAQSFTALSFRFIRSTALTRHGSKRIGGLAEASLDGNGTDSSLLTAITAYQDVVAAPIAMVSEVFPEFSAAPVIVGRIHEGLPNAGDLDLTKINPVSAVQFIRVTSQATRRAGRGI